MLSGLCSGDDSCESPVSDRTESVTGGENMYAEVMMEDEPLYQEYHESFLRHSLSSPSDKST